MYTLSLYKHLHVEQIILSFKKRKSSPLLWHSYLKIQMMWREKEYYGYEAITRREPCRFRQRVHVVN